MKPWTWCALFVQLALLSLGAVEIQHADADTQYVKAHPCPPRATHVVYRDRVVYKRTPEVNEMFVRAGQMCRGDGGVGTILLFPMQPANFETLCAFGHRAFTDAGMRL
jgi:hypothetical protein